MLTAQLRNSLPKLVYSQVRNYGRLCSSAEEACKDVQDGAFFFAGGFGVCGAPENIYRHLKEKNVKDLTIITNSAGCPDFGQGLLLRNGQISCQYGSFVGDNPDFQEFYLAGKFSALFFPQGSLCEKMRAAAYGIGAFYTPTGVGTYIETGGFPKQLRGDGEPISFSDGRIRRNFEGREYLLEPAFNADFSFAKAYQADRKGNLRFRKTARNFNPDVCGAGRQTIVEVEEIVDEIPPNQIHVPGYFVDKFFKGDHYLRRIERLRTRDPNEPAIKVNLEPKNDRERRRMRIIERSCQELKDGYFVNLGLGLPTMCGAQMAQDSECILQTENGLVGMGPYPFPDDVDHDIVNATKETVGEQLGHAYCKSSDSHGMIRGGHLYLTMLGALQVSETGDIANWIVPGELVKGMGGAMDLCSGSTGVIATMEHVAKGGVCKLLSKCTLPLTGEGVVSKVITDLAVFEFRDRVMYLTEIAPGVTLHQIKQNTQANYIVADDIKQMNVTV